MAATTSIPNWYVLKTVMILQVSIFVCAYYIGTMNGVLEMRGFQESFRELYNSSDPQGGGDGEMMNTSDTQTRTCSTSNGAAASIIIGIIISISNVTQLFGSLIAGWLADKFSRKYSIIIGSLVMVLGNTILASAYSIWMLILGRFFGGIAYAIIAMVPPIHVTELCPKEVRGTMTSIAGVAFALGIIAALCANIGFAKFAAGWRLSLASVSLIAVIHAAATKFVPHSPRWLVHQHREHEALLVLSRINHQDSRKENFVESYLELEEIKANIVRKTWCSQMKDLYPLKFRLMVTLTLFFINSTIGINIYYYSTTMFCVIGVEPFYSSLALGIITLLGSFVLIFASDRVGRRTLFLVSTGVNFLISLAVAILTQLFPTSNLVVAYVNVTLICLYVFSLNCSWVTMVWAISAEIFPSRVRGLTVAISTAGNALFNVIGNQLTPLILGSSLSGFFYLITGENLCAFLFILFALPEMKGVGLEKIDELFSLSCPKFVAQNLQCQDFTCGKSQKSQLHFRNRIFSQGEFSFEDGIANLEEKNSYDAMNHHKVTG